MFLEYGGRLTISQLNWLPHLSHLPCLPVCRCVLLRTEVEEGHVLTGSRAKCSLIASNSISYSLVSLKSMADLREPIELRFEPDTELADRDPQPFSVDLIRASKVVTTVTHARYGKFDGKTACLLVFRSDFVPDYKVRFKFVEIALKIVRAEDSSIIAYRPYTWHGMAAELPIKQSSGIGGRFGGSAGEEEAGLDTGVETNDKQWTEIKKAQILSVLEDSTVTWLLSENDVKREGVPNPFTAALIIETDGDFSIRVIYHANLSESADPSSQKPAYARLTRPLDLGQRSVGTGRGPSVADMEEMEKDSFDLNTLAPADWNL